MAINELNISYPDFVLNTTIDPEQFDTNNAEIVNKINELLNTLHSIEGAREIVADTIVGVSASTDLQSMLVALKTYVDTGDATLLIAINANNTAITNLQTNKADKTNIYLRTEVYNRTESDTRLNTHKTSNDHDSRYYTKDELATNVLKITNPGINVNVKDYSTIATAGQTVFTLPSGVYSKVTDLLEVFYKGSKLAITSNYKINNDTQFELVGWSAEAGAEVVAQVQAKVWNTQDLVSGRQLQDGTVDLVKLNVETQDKIISIDTKASNEDLDNLEINVSEQLAQSMTFETAIGTPTAITLTLPTLMNGYAKTFIASANNNGNATTINGIPLYKPSTIIAPKLITGKAYTVWYNLSGNCFFIKASATGTVTSDKVLAGETYSTEEDTDLVGTAPGKSAQTFTPGTTNQTIASGQFIIGTQTILGSANLIASNIKNGVNIFGVNGIMIPLTTEKKFASGQVSVTGTTMSIRGLAFTPSKVMVTILWNPGAGDRMLNVMISNSNDLYYNDSGSLANNFYAFSNQASTDSRNQIVSGGFDAYLIYSTGSGGVLKYWAYE